jgi:hypothetical protein
MAALSSFIVVRMIGMRMTVETQQQLRDGNGPEYVYHNRTVWHCEVFFCGQKVWQQRISTKKCCPCVVNIVCHVKQSIIGFRRANKYRRRTSSRSASGDFHVGKEFYAADFQGLVKWWDKCLNLFGDYVEK